MLCIAFRGGKSYGRVSHLDACIGWENDVAGDRGHRYQLQPGVPIRMIKTHHGILLVPLTDTPMSRALAEELEKWQALGAESFTMFPYEDVEA